MFHNCLITWLTGNHVILIKQVNGMQQASARLMLENPELSAIISYTLYMLKQKHFIFSSFITKVKLADSWVTIKQACLDEFITSAFWKH